MQISIVTPSFNQARYLERTIESVLAQRRAEFQYIVVDGGSSDGSIEILERYRDSLDVLIIEPDKGQADAIEKGFRHATGDLLCYLNSDDVLLEGTFEYVVNYFERRPDVDALYTNRIFVDEDDRITKFWILPRHSDYCMSRWDFIPQETCFWRNSLMERSGGIDPDFRFALDYDLFVRMMSSGKFVRIPRFSAGFRIHPEAKSSTQYETIGRSEIAKVQDAQNIQLRWYDILIKYLFGGSILAASWLYSLFQIRRIRRTVTLPWKR